ncbi:MAG: glutathione S-transferase family protein [Silicimonas sp.]|nr:glutathione S-transferase family protein [Silicimonas sp.]
MLKLYNAGTSVCSVKARIGLAEKGLAWEDELLVLPNGDQYKPAYLKLNPNGVVPTLVDGDTVVIESSVILQYIDAFFDGPQLMPQGKALQAETLVWLLRCVEIHQAINTMSFATANRERILNSKSPAEIDALIAAMPNPRLAAKRRDLIENGSDSAHLEADFYVLKRVFDDMNTALSTREWMNGDSFGMTDIALLAYIDRLDRIAMSGMWESRTPRIGAWLDAGRARPSYSRALDSYVSSQEHAKSRSVGERFWPDIGARWSAFLAA